MTVWGHTLSVKGWGTRHMLASSTPHYSVCLILFRSNIIMLRTSAMLLWISNMMLQNIVALLQDILHCFECSKQCKTFWNKATLFRSSMLLIQSSMMLVQQKTSIMLLWMHCFTFLSLTHHVFIKTCSLFLIKAWHVRERNVKQCNTIWKQHVANSKQCNTSFLPN